MFTENISISAILSFLVVLLAFGVLCIFLRDLAPGKAQRSTGNALSKRLESRLTHIPRTPSTLTHLVVGFLHRRLSLRADSRRQTSGLVLAGMLLSLGLGAEILIGVPPLFVLICGVSPMLVVEWPAVTVRYAEVFR